jgi:cell wall-associated NlpC family hydrolase
MLARRSTVAEPSQSDEGSPACCLATVMETETIRCLVLAPDSSPDLLLPGDLVFIPGADGTMQAPGHVSMYLGDGYVIEAPQTGDVVKIVPLIAFGPIAAMRHYG